MNEVNSSTTYIDKATTTASTPTLTYTPLSAPEVYKHSIQSTSKSINQNPTTTSQKVKRSKKQGKVGSFLHKLSCSWNLLFLRLRTISDEVFSSDQSVKDLFIQQNDGNLQNILTNRKSGSDTNNLEEQFLEDFEQSKSLEQMYINNKSKQLDSQGVNESGIINGNQYGHVSGNNPKLLLQAALHIDDRNLSDQIEVKVPFESIDFCEMRKEFEASKNENDEESMDSTVDKVGELNIGDALWNYRRTQWLSTDLEEDEILLRTHDSRSLVDKIPKESYPAIYSQLVNKGKILKDGARINLNDLINIINAGWIAEEKWERAARGLA